MSVQLLPLLRGRTIGRRTSAVQFGMLPELVIALAVAGALTASLDHELSRYVAWALAWMLLFFTLHRLRRWRERPGLHHWRERWRKRRGK